jgi:hypothetical protein
MTDRDTNDSKSAQQPVMMPAYFPQPSDEIDLFELLEQLWRGKLTILGTMVLALALGTWGGGGGERVEHQTARYALN